MNLYFGIKMTNLNEIWENIKTVQRTKTLWFDTPEEASRYIRDIINQIDNNLWIANESNDEIGKDEVFRLLEDYCKYQNSFYITLEKDVGKDYLEIYLEHWGLYSDSDTYADVLTFSK